MRLRHIGRAALLSAHDEVDLVADVVEGVESRDVRLLAGDAEDPVDGLQSQTVDQDLRSCPSLLLTHRKIRRVSHRLHWFKPILPKRNQ
ncbi:hypothetical protein BTHI11S_01874 [Bosea thiooxidans]